MSEIISKISTLSRTELEGAIEDIWAKANVIQRLTFLLDINLEKDFKLGRATRIDGNTVTLMFQKRGIDATLWLAGETWSKTADLLEILDDLNSSVETPAGKAASA
ncbi:hypothetical protein [Aquamicrobium sp.]|uniref:hypothetical protein n=1 Tax=Aquamicrobium sp. TaxID=1872579 RepID=UPI00258CE61D|nr:hypothetical protein [Aquamicrobium sp.]MCK9552256.1 hypothetical protein [Aquamicrobium sp.]